MTPFERSQWFVRSCRQWMKSDKKTSLNSHLIQAKASLNDGSEQMSRNTTAKQLAALLEENKRQAKRILELEANTVKATQMVRMALITTTLISKELNDLINTGKAKAVPLPDDATVKAMMEFVSSQK